MCLWNVTLMTKVYFCLQGVFNIIKSGFVIFFPNAVIENLCLGPQCHSCPENWVWFRCRCYYFSKEKLTWRESQSACSSLNSSLIKINKEEMVSCKTEHHNGMWNMWSRLSGLSWELFTFTWPQFSSVQSLSHVWLFATPWIAARQASLSITNSRSSLRLTSIESVMPSRHLTLCCPLLLLPQIPPSIRVFSNESTLCIRWPKYWSFSTRQMAEGYD